MLHYLLRNRQDNPNNQRFKECRHIGRYPHTHTITTLVLNLDIKTTMC